MSEIVPEGFDLHSALRARSETSPRNEREHFVCPGCGTEPYRGKKNGRNMYRCNADQSECEWRCSPLARTKDQLRRVNLELESRKEVKA